MGILEIEDTQARPGDKRALRRESPIIQHESCWIRER
jgi:hypothetical protein